MPLRDHFRPPVELRETWEGLLAQWAGTIVQSLRTVLPPEFTAGPFIGFDADNPTPINPTRGEFFGYDCYRVHVYDRRSDRRIVATIVVVSPMNKEFSDQRSEFVQRCSDAFLQAWLSASWIW